MAGERISFVVDSRGVNAVRRDLNKLHSIGDRVRHTFGRMTSAIGGFAKSIWRHKVMIAAAAAGIGYAVFKPFIGLEETLARTQVASGEYLPFRFSIY